MVLFKARLSALAMPRPILVLSALSVVGSAGLVVLQLPLVWDDKPADLPATTVVTGLVSVALLTSFAKLFNTGNSLSEEERAWRLMLIGPAIISGFALAAQVLDLFDHGSQQPTGAGNPVFSIGCVVACGPIYLGGR